MIADVLRLLLFGLAGVGIGLALLVAAPYVRALKRRRGDGFLLGYHVVAVAVSWVLLVIASLDGTFTRFGRPVGWHFWFRLTGVALGVAALVLLLRHLRIKTADIAHDEKRMASLQAQVDLIRRQRRAR